MKVFKMDYLLKIFCICKEELKIIAYRLNILKSLLKCVK